MTTTRPPRAPSRSLSGLDRNAERLLRGEIQEVVSQLLGEAELLSPGPEDEARIRALIPPEARGAYSGTNVQDCVLIRIRPTSSCRTRSN